MSFRRVRQLADLVVDAVKFLTVDALKTAATFLFEPTYRVRGHVKVQCDDVRVHIHPAVITSKEVDAMSNEELSNLAGSKSRPGKMRGAIPSAPHKLAAAMPFIAVEAPPAQVVMVPSVLHVFGNDRFGDCVSAEEGFAKLVGVPYVDVGDSVVIQWASRHGVLNGADLADVLDMMRSDGFKVGTTQYNDGAKLAVDYSNETVLQAALATGPVKIAIDADALPSGAGDHNGWYSTSGQRYRNTDHCVSVCGYGPAGVLFAALGVPLPSGLAATQTLYLVFTWGTIGVVSHEWLMGTCTEAWVRNPTTVANPPVPTPTPTPVPPTPTPTPVPAQVGQMILTQPLQPGTYPIGPGLAVVVGSGAPIPWALLLQILIAFLNGLVPVIPPTPTPVPVPGSDVKLTRVA